MVSCGPVGRVGLGATHPRAPQVQEIKRTAQTSEGKNGALAYEYQAALDAMNATAQRLVAATKGKGKGKGAPSAWHLMPVMHNLTFLMTHKELSVRRTAGQTIGTILTCIKKLKGMRM